MGCELCIRCRGRNFAICWFSGKCLRIQCYRFRYYHSVQIVPLFCRVGWNHSRWTCERGDKNETSKIRCWSCLIQLVPFCGAPLLSIFLSFIRETELGGKSTEQMSTIATTVATLLLLECTLTPILTILDIGSLIMRMINSISSACCNIMPFGPNSCWGPLKFTYVVFGVRAWCSSTNRENLTFIIHFLIPHDRHISTFSRITHITHCNETL